jgi:predicted transposase YdaD
VSKKFDATLKAILEAAPADWAKLAGVTASEVTVVDGDVSTVTAAADKVLRVADERILQFDFQSGPDASVPARALRYNVSLEDRHSLPVQSVVVLMRAAANLNVIDGSYRQTLPGAVEPYLDFRYQVIRVWELRPADLLVGGVGTLPLAPISGVTEADLPGVIQQMKQILESPPHRPLAGDAWAATNVLMGLRYRQELIDQLLQGVQGMEESVTYRAIVEKGRVEGYAKGRVEGRVEEAQRMLVRIGEAHFKTPPSPATLTAIEAMTQTETLEELAVRVGQVNSWEELLPTASGARVPNPRRGRRKRS